MLYVQYVKITWSVTLTHHFLLCMVSFVYTYLGCFCCWLIIVLWLLMSIYLIVTGTYCCVSVCVLCLMVQNIGILYECPGQINIKRIAIMQGSINIGFAVVLIISIMRGEQYTQYRESSIECVSTFGGILYLGFFVTTVCGTFFALISLNSWKNGELACSSGLFVGELTYLCFICISFVIFLAIICVSKRN